MKVKQVTKKVTKKTYKTPTLKVYGKVKDLTAAGSKNNPEGGSGRRDKKAAPG